MSTLRNRKLIGWKIFYSDGETINSKNAQWIFSRQTGVQIVKLFYRSDNGIETNIITNQEYYLLNDLLKLPNEIKTGEAIPYKDYLKLVEAAENDESIITQMYD